MKVCINCGKEQDGSRFCEICGDNLKDMRVKPKEEVKENLDEKEVKDKLEDVKEDLADDGKRNYSHDPKRKSPGRKKRKWIKWL